MHWECILLFVMCYTEEGSTGSFTAHDACWGLAVSLLMVGSSDDEVKAHCR